MNSRSGDVDLARFLASLFIMTHHLFVIGFSKYQFFGTWIYVEFFLIITGYYTAKHFDGKNYDNPVKESIIYTLKKFIPFLPYTIITTVLLYLLNLIPRLLAGELNIKGFIFSFVDDFIFDILLVTESYNKQPLNGSLWYISAMFIIFPLFSWLMQIRNRYWILFITSIYSLFYYGAMGVRAFTLSYQDFFRIITGLCLGALVYELIYVFSDYINKTNKYILTVIEIITFIIPIIIIIKYLGSTRFILLCFTVCLAIMLPNLSYTSKIGGECKVFTYLGRLSMPIYIIHWFIGSLIEYLSNNLFLWSDTIKIVLFFGGTIIVAMIAMYLVDHWKWFQNVIKKPIILKD